MTAHTLCRARAAGAVAAALWLAACGGAPEAEPAKAPPVATAHVEARDLEDRLSASGELVARLQTTLAAEVAGRITAIPLEEGDAVDAGTLVVAIDPERRELDLASARAQAAQAAATLERERREASRMRTLRGSDVASQSKLDAAETALALAEAGLASARAQVGVAERTLRDASVAAPFAGLLARRLVNLGQFVQPGTLLFELVSLDPIDVVFHVAEVDSGRVQVGQRVAVEVAPYPQRRFDAVVDVVAPTIDRATRTLRVRARIDNADGALRPGLFARADLGVATRENVALVPEDAVLQRSDGQVVFRLGADGRVERRLVRTGTFYPAGLEIVSGVLPGDVVVVRGHTALVDGARVEVTSGPGAPPGLAPGDGLARRSALPASAASAGSRGTL